MLLWHFSALQEPCLTDQPMRDFNYRICSTRDFSLSMGMCVIRPKLDSQTFCLAWGNFLGWQGRLHSASGIWATHQTCNFLPRLILRRKYSDETRTKKFRETVVCVKNCFFDDNVFPPPLTQTKTQYTMNDGLWISRSYHQSILLRN